MFKATIAPQDPMILQFVPILTQACEILREEYQRYCSGAAFDIVKKSDDSPVTQADYRVNSYLTQALAEISELPLLSEEGQQDQRHAWTDFWLLWMAPKSFCISAPNSRLISVWSEAV